MTTAKHRPPSQRYRRVAACLHCGQHRYIHGRGLCSACWFKPAIRNQYAVVRNTRPIGPLEDDGTPRPPCKHCNLVPQNRPRGLCFACYQNRSIRNLYPRDANTAPKLAFLPLLPLLRTYPDGGYMPRCEHGRRDGECAACERRQREAVGIVVEVGEEGEE